ncbi:MAG: hypothetical protein Kow0090_09840 [Myxococcota bacterium]
MSRTFFEFTLKNSPNGALFLTLFQLGVTDEKHGILTSLYIALQYKGLKVELAFAEI